MAPLDKLPAPVVQARAKLAESGVVAFEKSADNVKKIAEALKMCGDKGLLNKLASNCRNTMTPEVKSKYKLLSTDDERREWLAYYVIDAKDACNNGFNRTLVFDTESSDTTITWLTEEQMSGPNWLNSKEHAKMVVEHKVLTDRPHEWELFAQQGILQWEFSWAKIKRSTGWRKEAGVETTAELSGEEVATIRDHIDGQGLKTQQKKRRPTRKKKTKQLRHPRRKN